MSEQKSIYFEEDADLNVIKNDVIAIIGYGNQGRAQALNLKDHNLKVIVGNRDDDYRKRAVKDGFEALNISEAVKKADIVFMLTPDETMPNLFKNEIKPNLKKDATINFASGYNIAFDLVKPPKNINVIMIAPRMIGVGVRETYLSGKGFFSFICVHHDASGNAKQKLLALAKGIGTLIKGAIFTTMKQEAILDLFNEQAFGPAFGRVLLTSISTLIDNGLPPEAVLVEMYMSGEMSYTYQKMANIGLVKQTDFHSHTSQYGAMSRGAKYLGIGKELKRKFQNTFENIESGDFAKEWSKNRSKAKFKVIKAFATRQKISKIEQQVRKNLRMKEIEAGSSDEVEEILAKHPELKDELNDLKRDGDSFIFSV